MVPRSSKPGTCSNMGQISAEITRLPGSLLSGNQHHAGRYPQRYPQRPWISKSTSGNRWTLDTKKPLFPAVFSISPDFAERTNGAQKRTRTSTTLRSPAPEAGASTNSAIWARGRSGRLAAWSAACQQHVHPRAQKLLPSSQEHKIGLSRPRGWGK